MMAMIARMIRMIMTDSWFKQGFKHGWHVNMRSMRRIFTGDYHADKPSYVNPLPSLPSIREWLEQHGGTSMNAQELDACLHDYQHMLDERDKNMDDYIKGMRFAVFSYMFIGIIIPVIIMILILLL